MQRTLIPLPSLQALGFCLAITLFEWLTYMASDMVMPAMLTVTRDLEADAAHIPNAFNLYLIGGVCLQWLIGPLSDRFGRRPLLLGGCALFGVTCAAAVATPGIEVFNALRLMQGMGLGFVVAVSYPALQEVFCEADAVRLMALLSNVALLSPLLGPLLGSLLLEWLSWRELFLGLGLIATLTWIGLYACMPETIGVVRHDGGQQAPIPFSFRQISSRYLLLLRNHRFVGICLALGLMSLPLIAWIGMSPLLLVQSLGLTTREYALWQIPVFSAVIVGNLILDRLLASRELPQLIRLALWPFCLGLLTLIATALSSLSLAGLMTGLALYAVGLGMSNAALYRLALFSSDDSKGLVSATIGMISIAVMGVGGSLIAAIGGGTRLESFAMWAALGGLLSLPLLYRFLPHVPADSASST
ncbi:MFS transporter [Pseudomonas fluorescens]|uniref:Multidrug transporter MdfA n=1 Tax=Pseudomonas fluorescens (strain Pf0-1) TaxID=205922 RepID=Q3KD54_PSEPF|nr:MULTISPECIES: MFS transporter [Pseudomonas]ABA74301.1 multidrug translocase [Pseudomonas fluorescens Pf0-1]MBY9025924.1 MFS transporter [Pseudomonas fluorescens]MBY9031269.1 MFS transporter [Pseudomonas fluorescens]MBY9037742.1 MFS transporter [Pseudomonas fluorescens]MBY9041336.1 MFS transporter [Pseudomonas fluorescens]